MPTLGVVTILARLRDELDGELFTPDFPGYEAVRRPANASYRDAHPQLVIRCGSAADVALGIRYARATAACLSSRAAEATASRGGRRPTVSCWT